MSCAAFKRKYCFSKSLGETWGSSHFQNHKCIVAVIEIYHKIGSASFRISYPERSLICTTFIIRVSLPCFFIAPWKDHRKITPFECFLFCNIFWTFNKLFCSKIISKRSIFTLTNYIKNLLLIWFVLGLEHRGNMKKYKPTETVFVV